MIEKNPYIPLWHRKKKENSRKSFLDTRTIQRLFKEQVKRTPDRIALVESMGENRDDVQYMSYSELDRQTGQLAPFLRNNDAFRITPGDSVAVMMQQGVLRVVAILALIKTGATVIVIHPIQPEKRIRRIMDDCAVRVVLSQSNCLPVLNPLLETCAPFDSLLCMDTLEIYHHRELNSFATESQWAQTTVPDEIPVKQESPEPPVLSTTKVNPFSIRGVVENGKVKTNRLPAPWGGIEDSVEIEPAILFCDFDSGINEFFSYLLVGASIFLAPTYGPSNISTIKDFYTTHCITNKIDEISAWETREQYWQDQLGEPFPLLQLPTDFSREEEKCFAADTTRFALDDETLQQVQSFVEKRNMTLEIFLLAIYYILLHRYSGQEDIVIGVAGNDSRNVPGKMNDMFFDNMYLDNVIQEVKSFDFIPVRHFFQNERNITQFLEEIKTDALKAYENCDFPFALLAEPSDFNGDYKNSWQAGAGFCYLCGDEGSGDQIIDQKIKQHFQVADVTFFCLETNELAFYFQYNAALFRKERMKQFARHFDAILRRVIEAPDVTLGSIDFLSEPEKHFLLDQLNDVDVPYPENRTIHHWFQDQVEKTPDHIALFEGTNGFFGTVFLTYHELNDRAEGLSFFLVDRGIGRGSIVALLINATPEMLMVILAILKTGAAYLPIDPTIPEDRVRYILKDSAASFLFKGLVNDDKKEHCFTRELGIPVMSTGSLAASHGFGELTEDAPGPQPENIHYRQNTVEANDPAYVIYTSRPSGKPKGVMVEHHSLANLCAWHIREFSLTGADRIGQYAGVGSDASVWEIFPTLIVGAALYFIPDSIKKDIASLNLFLVAHDITVAFLPTQVCESFMEEENSSLRVLVAGGILLKKYVSRSYRLINTYGPTENTVVSTFFTVKTYASNILIGKPINNTWVLILDSNGNLQPVGVPGELVLSGAGIARGYMNQPELTSESFASGGRGALFKGWANGSLVPGGPQEPYRSFRTGDLARWNFDGNIEFLGRIDPGEYESGNWETPSKDIPNEKNKMKLKLEAGDKLQNNIAVIGMAGRFPGAKDIRQFHQNLEYGVESISFFTDDELKEAGVDSRLMVNPNYVKASAFMEYADHFDARFFGYNSSDAQLMDPQVRVFHHCVHEALENAGYHPSKYNGRIGLYAGAGSSLYWENQIMKSRLLKPMEFFNAKNLIDSDFMCSRISYNLNLNGPGFSVKTACSTALTAIHQACHALRNRECHMALAGGVSIQGSHKQGYLYQDGMVMSSDGHCRAFDSRADGTIFGSGAGVVVLKLLDTALQDRDHIYAVVKGSAVNNDGGRKSGYSDPSVEGQAEVIREAQRVAGVSPETITAIEAHGTGSQLGDSVEVDALTLAFNTNKRKYCALGSVKTNIGHLDTAAGAAGFIKTVLSLYHRRLFPSLNFDSPNPAIDFENSPFYVNTQLQEWKTDGHPLRAGVSAFGIGGANAHIILEEPPAPLHKPEETGDTLYKLLLLSAHSKTALNTATANLNRYLQDHPDIDLVDVAYTLQVGRGNYPYKRTVVCRNIDEAVETLTASVKTTHPHSDSYSLQIDNPQCVFMFSGPETQYINIALELYPKIPLFRQHLDRCFDILNTLVDDDIKTILFPCPGETQDFNTRRGHDGTQDLNSVGESDSNRIPLIHQIEIVSPMVFSIQYALAQLLINWGIRPRAMIGSSIGEYTCACISGVISLENALKLAVMHGHIMQSLPSIDSSDMPVPEEQLIRIHEPVDTLVRKITFNPPTIPYISNLTGTWVTPEQISLPHYWTSHIQSTVWNDDSIPTLFTLGNPVFIEIAPGNKLSTHVREHDACPEECRSLIINLFPDPLEALSNEAYLTKQIGKCWSFGIPIDWSAYNAHWAPRRVPLPTYPFESQSFRLENSSHHAATGSESHSQPHQLERKPHMQDWFYVPGWERRLLVSNSQSDSEHLSSWLIFTDSCGIGDAVANFLRRNRVQVVTIDLGGAFANPQPGHYVLPPRYAHGYRILIKDLKEKGLFPLRILHMWNVTGDRNKTFHMSSTHSNTQSVNAALDIAYYSILETVRAIGEEGIKEDVYLAVVSDWLQDVTGEETLQPLKAVSAGCVTVIPVEYPNVRTAGIDISPPAHGSPAETGLVRQLTAEIMAGLPDAVVAFRRHHRWVRTYQPHPLKKPDFLGCLRKKGVYLITGGMGGIGISIAQYLAEQVSARLVLINRTEFPPREKWDRILEDCGPEDPVCIKIKKLKQMATHGAEIMIATADITDHNLMRTLLAAIDEHFGPINGVIHAAGVADFGGIIQQRTPDDDKSVMASKITGTLVLDDFLKNMTLDFIILCSSLGNRFASSQLGQVAYTASNEFLETFAAYRTAETGVFTTAINWPQWAEIDMSVTAQEKTGASEKLGASILSQGALTLEEGIGVMESVLHGALVQVSVSPLDLSVLNDALVKLWKDNLVTESSIESVHDSVLPSDTGNDYIAPRNETEKRLAEIWREHLSIETIGVADNFFTLGGDSLVAARLVQAINEKFDITLPANILLVAASIEAIARMIDERADRIQEEEEVDPAFLSLVRLQPGKPGNTPLFMVHPIGGHVYFYRSLAEAVGDQHPVYGLQALGLDGRNKPLNTIEKMAAHYIEEIRCVQPVGPYYLGGSSFGGMVVFEMAQQLKAADEEVGALFMVDTAGPGHLPRALEDDAELLAYYLNAANRALDITAGDIRKMNEIQRNEFLARYATQLDAVGGGQGWEEIKQILDVYRANFNAMLKYEPHVYDGTLHYFRALEESEGNPKTPEKAWISFAAGGIDIHDVPGDHITMNDLPNVKVIGDVVKTYFESPVPST